MMVPLVSILIPAYNAEAWLADTIRSAIAQTWPRKEIIVVDDGSKDGTLQVAKQFTAADVSTFSQPNQGAAAARNKAFELSRGDYIQWLDADDLLSPRKVENQMKVALASDPRVLLSCGWGHFMYRPSAARIRPTKLWCDLTPVEWLVRKWENNDHMQTATWLVSRQLTEMAGPWDTRLLGDDDGEYFFRVIKASDHIKFVSDATVYYRVTTAGRLSYIGHSDKKIEAQFLGMKLQIDYLLSIADNARVRAACVNYLQTWLPNFYPRRLDIAEQARQLARTLGGELRPPRLAWKYRWIERLFGWDAAKMVQRRYNLWKTLLLRAGDKALFALQRGNAN